MVLLNFMQNKDQFLRETSARKSHQLESKFVVGISKAYDGDVDPTFLKASVRSYGLGRLQVRNRHALRRPEHGHHLPQ